MFGVSGFQPVYEASVYRVFEEPALQGFEIFRFGDGVCESGKFFVKFELLPAECKPGFLHKGGT